MDLGFTIALLSFAIFVFVQGGIVPSVTVEKGGRAVLRCSGSERRRYLGFYGSINWYKGEGIGGGNLVASNRESDDHEEFSHDLAGRATINKTSGALVIPETRVTDDHNYTCASGFFRSRITHMKLTVTVTPTPQDLRIFDSGPVEEGKSITCICVATEIKPPPRRMYFKFKNNSSPLATNFKNSTNEDGLTLSVSVSFTFAVNRTHQGKRLQCVFVTSTGKSITSVEEQEIIVLYQEAGNDNIGKPVPNITVVIFGSLLGIFVCATIILAICLIYTCRRNTCQKNTKQTTSNQSTTRDSHYYSEIELQRQSSMAAHPAPAAGNNAEEAQIYENF